MKNQLLLKISIFSVMFVIFAGNIVTPAIQTIAEVFSDVSYTTILLISTLPVLIGIPFTFIAGAIAGKKIKFKTLALLGIILTLVGVMPVFFYNSIVIILISRALFGIGVGLLIPLGNTLIMRFFDGQSRANMLGASTVVHNAAAVFFLMVSSVLCSINWKFIFYLHAIIIVPLFLVLFFLKEPETSSASEAKSEQKLKIPFGFYVMSFVMCIVMIIMMPLLLNMSTIISLRNLGDVTMTGMVLSTVTIAGLVAGAIFGLVHKAFKTMTFPLGLFLLSVGMGCVYFAGSILLVFIGVSLVGIGINFTVSASLMIVGAMLEPSSIGMAMGLIMAIMQLGNFLSTYYIAFIIAVTGSTSAELPIFYAMIGYFVLTLIFIVQGVLKKKPQKV